MKKRISLKRCKCGSRKYFRGIFYKKGKTLYNITCMICDTSSGWKGSVEDAIRFYNNKIPKSTK